MSLLVDNIAELTTHSPEGTLTNAALVIEAGHIAWLGPSDRAPAADERIDAHGGAVIPGFVDSHTHLVFAGDRAEEFNRRMSGNPYTGGGIRTTVEATRAAADETLRANLTRLVTEARRQGTTTLEVKSGYGLTVADEARSLRIAQEFTEETTYLGAHIIPKDWQSRAEPGSNTPSRQGQRSEAGVPTEGSSLTARSGHSRLAEPPRGAEGDPSGYVSLVCGEMLTAARPYAKWIDVFCERGAFDVDQAREILTAGVRAGLLPRIHANQLSQGGGVQLAVELDCASADHCTHLSTVDVDALAGSTTVATLLPGAEFSTRSPYPDARRLLDAGATVALASDCNPGSSYTTSMPFCIALAVREMRMTPAEALWSATAGGARALRRTDIGHLGVGARADLAILDAPSAVHLAYRPGVPLVRTVLRNGEPT